MPSRCLLRTAARYFCPLLCVYVQKLKTRFVLLQVEDGAGVTCSPSLSASSGAHQGMPSVRPFFFLRCCRQSAALIQFTLQFLSIPHSPDHLFQAASSALSSSTALPFPPTLLFTLWLGCLVSQSPTACKPPSSLGSFTSGSRRHSSDSSTPSPFPQCFYVTSWQVLHGLEARRRCALHSTPCRARSR